MTAVAQRFIRVVPAEIGRHGFAGATVLALIRYRCATDGPGRFVADGVRWWRASLADIAAELHVSRDVVKRTLKSLGDAVAAKNFESNGGRTLAYHVSALTSERAESPQAGQRKGESATTIGRNRHDHGAESPFAPLHGEGGEGGEAAATGHAAPAGLAASNQQTSLLDDDPEPSRYCAEHQPDGIGRPCPACGRARKEHEAWRAREPERKSAAAQKRAAAIATCERGCENGWIAVGADAVDRCDCNPGLNRHTA